MWWVWVIVVVVCAFTVGMVGGAMLYDDPNRKARRAFKRGDRG